MRTQIAGSTGMLGAAETRQMIVQKLLLVCGILSSLLYTGATILGAARWEGYSSASQSVSELIAIDAPSRPLLVPLFLAYAMLVFAFGLGVWRSAGRKRALRIVAVLVVAKEVLGSVVTLFAPIHLRGVEGTLSDTMHLVLTGVGVFLCMFPAIGFSAAAFGRRFRVYSIGTMLVFLVFGILASADAPLVAANLPTPFTGVLQRINIFGYMLWVVVLAITLLRPPSERSRSEAGGGVVHPEAAAGRA